MSGGSLSARLFIVQLVGKARAAVILPPAGAPGVPLLGEQALQQGGVVVRGGRCWAHGAIFRGLLVPSPLADTEHLQPVKAFRVHEPTPAAQIQTPELLW